MEIENTRFNAEVQADLMYIAEAPVLHMADYAAHFSAAQFVALLTTEPLWEAILMLLAAVYIGLLNILVFDDGSQFRDTIVETCKIRDVEEKRSGTQHHSALGIWAYITNPLDVPFENFELITKAEK